MTILLGEGGIRKMHTALTDTSVEYALPLGDGLVPLNALLGQSISLTLSFENVKCTM